MAHPATVHLVGAGPGDAGLLTVRGARLLARADIVVYDALVNPELLSLAPADAERVFAGKRNREHRMPQEELNQLLVSRAKAGHRVVRLKGGDPYVFGRGGEEAAALAAAGIAFEVVPGVSSLAAVPACAGIPITHRGLASGLTVVTGHEDPAKPETAVDWAAVARVPGTKVVMMATGTVDRVAAELVRHGMAPATPAAVISWGSTPRQRTLVATLADIGARAIEERIPPPAILVVGEVVRLRDRLNWFEHRPLFGRRIVVTRARDQAGAMAEAFREGGAEVLEIPAIRIGPPAEREPLIEALSGLREYDWLVFTSANGVTAFFDLFLKAFDDLRDIGGLRIAAVGAATAARVRDFHLKVDAMPKEFLAAKVVEAIEADGSVENLRFLLLRAQVATPDLPKLLEDKGGIVDDIACYQTLAETEDDGVAATRLIELGADWLTFTSASTVQHFHERFDLPSLLKQFPAMRVASIGPETTAALEALQVEAAVTAKPHTTDGLVAAVWKACEG